MAVQQHTKMYRIVYRRASQPKFVRLIGSETDSRIQVDEVARCYAEDHPDSIVRIYNDEDTELEIQYIFKSDNRQLYYSFGLSGWMPYAE